jgi:hypothetical protein
MKVGLHETSKNFNIILYNVRQNINKFRFYRYNTTHTEILFLVTAVPVICNLNRNPIQELRVL